MINLRSSLIVVALVSTSSACLHADGTNPPAITIASLLHEMTDREAQARYPASDFRLKQASSYNRASVSPEDEKGWFNNKDNNTSEKDANFLRIEENHGRKEWVLMEDEGPGVVVRSWMPWRRDSVAETTSVIRFYLDGATEPALEGNEFELFQGRGMVPFPLAHDSLRSAVSFFPIPYARSCKVTVSERPFFYQLTYRKYPAGTAVKSFTMADFKAADATIRSTCETLLQPGVRAEGKSVSFQSTLGAREERMIDLPSGPSAVRTLSVRLDRYTDAAVMRQVVLKFSFDGKETVWCPLGDFFGSGIGLNPFQDWFRTVAEDGTLTCRWVMPYRESGKVALVNLGDEPVGFQLEAVVGGWHWDDRSLYFHAAWRGQYPVPTRPYADWNYVTLEGRGVYVGDTLTVMNPVEKWWGEGDEKIFVDGEKFPSLFGTGTEDYYGYSWGGRSTDFYEHPFHAQPFCHAYNKLSPKANAREKNTQGYSTETRVRTLDTMPFAHRLRLDMEVWSWTDCAMGYGVGVYWYGDAATISNRRPDPAAAVKLPPLPAGPGAPPAGAATR